MSHHRVLGGALAASLAVACGASSKSSEGPESPASATSTEATPSPEANSGGAEPSASATPAETAPAGSAEPEASAAAPAPGGDPDKRTMEVIAAVVKAHRKEARACYEEGQKQIPGLKGDLVVHFVLKPNGKVKSAELNEERSTIRDPSVVKCVVDVIAAIEFPRSSRGMETTVNYPFNFMP